MSAEFYVDRSAVATVRNTVPGNGVCSKYAITSGRDAPTQTNVNVVEV